MGLVYRNSFAPLRFGYGVLYVCTNMLSCTWGLTGKEFGLSISFLIIFFYKQIQQCYFYLFFYWVWIKLGRVVWVLMVVWWNQFTVILKYILAIKLSDFYVNLSGQGRIDNGDRTWPTSLNSPSAWIFSVSREHLWTMEQKIKKGFQFSTWIID